MTSIKAFELWLVWISVMVCCLMGQGIAHEGHKPLPTKGVEVQQENGTLVLSSSAREAIEVQTKEVSQGPLSSYLNAYGSLALPWRNHALVGSTIEGRVVSVKFVAGQQVKAGQVVAEIESPVIEEIQRNLRDLVAAVRLDQQLLQGAQEASKSGAIPMARLLEIQASLFQKETALKIAMAKWLGLGLGAEDLDLILKEPQTFRTVRLGLKTPISGTVQHNDLTIGKYVNLKEHVLEVIDLSTLWLKTEVLEKDLTRIRQGDAVEFSPTSRTADKVSGKISVIEKVLDPKSHVATAWVDLGNTLGASTVLLPGMTGQVRIGQDASSSRILVPANSLIKDGAERFVLVEQERTEKASLFRKIPVAIGVQNGGYAEIVRGEIFPGDRILTQGSRQLGHLFTQGVLRLSPEAVQDIGLKTQRVKPERVAKILTVDGVVGLPPSKLARVSPQLSGRVHEILVDRGEMVRQGQPLARILSTEFQDLQLEFIQSYLEMSFRESVVENIRQAGASIPQRQRLEAESLLVSARNQYQSKSRQLQLLGLEDEQLDSISRDQQVIEYFPVLAPIGGIIVGFSKAIGHIVAADEELFEVHDISERLVEGFVSEKDAGLISAGQVLRCQPVAQSNGHYPGRVLSSGQSLSNAGQTLSVWAQVDFDSEALVFHNMLCRLSIEITEARKADDAEESLPTIPLSSVLREGTQTYVFVALTDGTYERRKVILGRADDRSVRVVSGVEPLETVVVEGVAALQTGYAAIQ